MYENEEKEQRLIDVVDDESKKLYFDTTLSIFFERSLLFIDTVQKIEREKFVNK